MIETKRHSRVLDVLSKVVRVLTIPPVMALTLLCILLVAHPAMLGGVGWFVACTVCLCVLPVLAYPIQPLVPGFKDKGREGQRSLAMVMSVLGYVAGMLAAAIGKAPTMVWLIFSTYLVSGIGIAVFNKVLHLRASGHACGVAGPMCLFIYMAGPAGFASLALLALVFWASLRTKRHTLSQLVLGSGISVLAFLICRAVIAF